MLPRCTDRPVALLLSLTAAAAALADGPSFTGIGALDPGPNQPGSSAAGISASGLFIVGSSVVAEPSSGGVRLHAIRWSAAGGITDLGPLFGSNLQSAAAARISADGQIIAGAAGVAYPYGLETRNAGYWTFSAGIPLGHLLQSDDVVGYFAADLSADGSVIVGGTRYPGPTPVPDRAFRFSPTSGLEALPLLPGGCCAAATAISADGSVIAGYCDTPTSLVACRWTGASVEPLAGQEPGIPSGAYGISADGRVIVGEYNSLAMRWTQAAGFESLGTLPGGGATTAWDVSADGSVIVGRDFIDTEHQAAWVWDAGHGMRDLATVLTDLGLNLSGWTLQSAQGISDDGLTITGTGINPHGNQEGWVAHLGSLPCYANCDGSSATPILNVNDFVCFQTRYAAGDARANCDGSTVPPVLNVSDFVCFLNRYAAGCP